MSRRSFCISHNAAFVLTLAVILGGLVRAGVGAQPGLPDKMHALAIASIEYVYKEDFKQAQVEAKRIIKEYPDHPAGYFFFAAVLDAQMEQLQDDAQEVEFYRYCDLAVSRGEVLLEKNNDVWVRFFVGGGYGARGTYESRYSRWITAFRHGWQGVSVFHDVLSAEPDIKDALFGIATYDYWRSAMTRMLWWMPGVEDKREESIRTLYTVMRRGTYVREAAAKHLIPILNNEKRYAEALAVASEMICRYPNYLMFHWGKGEAELGLGKLDDAEKTFSYIVRRVDQLDASNNYNKVLSHYFLARVQYERRRYDLCILQCDRATGFQLQTDTKERLKTQLAEIAVIAKKANTEQRRGK